MKLNIYSIYDVVAEVFNKPFTDINNGTAIRAFTQSVQENVHKNDYVLYNLGQFDDQDGNIVKEKNPVKVLSGFDVKATVQEIPEQLKPQAI